MFRWLTTLAHGAVTLGEAHGLLNNRKRAAHGPGCGKHCWTRACGCYWHQHGDANAAGHGRLCLTHHREKKATAT
jgi:hypothetical protein